jgi:hypothetical protein
MLPFRKDESVVRKPGKMNQVIKRFLRRHPVASLKNVTEGGEILDNVAS